DLDAVDVPTRSLHVSKHAAATASDVQNSSSAVGLWHELQHVGHQTKEKPTLQLAAGSARPDAVSALTQRELGSRRVCAVVRGVVDVEVVRNRIGEADA